MKKCENCGFDRNQDKQKFCMKCGKPFAKLTSEEVIKENEQNKSAVVFEKKPELESQNIETENGIGLKPIPEFNFEEKYISTSVTKAKAEYQKNKKLINIIVISFAVIMILIIVVPKIADFVKENRQQKQLLNSYNSAVKLVDEAAVVNTTPTTTEITTEPKRKTKLIDIVGNKSGYTPDIEVDVSLADVSRAERTELINDVMYNEEIYLLITGGYCSDRFYYENSKLEIIFENESEYCEVDIELATNLDEMYSVARKCFTDNYISDNELNSIMFESENNYPTFKMVDNRLAVYTWSPHWSKLDDLDFENAGVVSYSGTTAEVWIGEEDRIGGGYIATNIFYMIRNSEDENWKIDKFERMW